jgi:hypothetical protein
LCVRDFQGQGNVVGELHSHILGICQHISEKVVPLNLFAMSQLRCIHGDEEALDSTLFCMHNNSLRDVSVFVDISEKYL